MSPFIYYFAVTICVAYNCPNTELVVLFSVHDDSDSSSFLEIISEYTRENARDYN